MEQKFNNEVIGISAEIAIADIFNVTIDNNYRMRGNTEIINLLKKDISKIFLMRIFLSLSNMLLKDKILLILF